ncbi:MAG: hypothetical protein ACPG1A_15715, partial [Halioglobus sp.]
HALQLYLAAISQTAYRSCPHARLRAGTVIVDSHHCKRGASGTHGNRRHSGRNLGRPNMVVAACDGN